MTAREQHGGRARAIFVEDFDHPCDEPAAHPQPDPEPVFSKTDVVAAHDAGWREGHATGLE